MTLFKAYFRATVFGVVAVALIRGNETVAGVGLLAVAVITFLWFESPDWGNIVAYVLMGGFLLLGAPGKLFLGAPNKNVEIYLGIWAAILSAGTFVLAGLAATDETGVKTPEH